MKALRGFASRLPVLALSLSLTTGCADAGQADEPGAATSAQPTQAPAPTPSAPQEIALSGTETDTDWQILQQRIEWARGQGLHEVSMGEAVARIGETFVGEPYTPRTLEVGAEAGTEALVVNLREFDCVTFVETALALARVVQSVDPSVTDPDLLRGRYIEELAGLRYRGGTIDGYPSRLHYFTDWIADNAARGRVEPLSHLLGGSEDPEPIDFMSTHADAYAQLADPAHLDQIRAIERDLSARPRYPIRENRIAQFADEIQSGDIIAATSTVAGLDVAHTGIALWRDGELRLMHAPLVGETVQISPESLAERVVRITGQDGIFVARPLATGPER